MKSNLLLFTPKFKQFLLIGTLHIILLGSIFAGVDIYQYQNEFDYIHSDGATPITPLVGSTSLFWMSYEQIGENGRSDQIEYALNVITQNNNHRKFPLLDVTYLDGHYGPLDNRTSLWWEILRVDDTVLIELEQDMTQQTSYNKTERSTTSYFLVSFDDILEPTSFSYKIYSSIDHPDLEIEAIHFDQDNSDYLQTVITASNTTYVTTIGEVDALLDITMSSGQIRNQPTVTEVSGGFSVLPEDLSELDLEGFIHNRLNTDQYQAVVVSGLFHNFQIIRVDDLNKIHLRLRSSAYDVGEGNYTAKNSAEYMYVDITNQVAQAWDVTPTSIKDDSYTYQDSRFMQILPGPQDTYIMVFYTPEISDYYSTLEYWYTSGQFDEDLYSQWWSQQYLQFVVFDPANPTLSNYIQFDPELSQTAQSTVIYPRFPSSTTVSNETTQYAATLSADQGSEVTLSIFAKMYPFENGYTSTLHFRNATGQLQTGNELSAYGTLVEYEYDINSTITFLGSTHLVGPDQGLKDDSIDYSGINSDFTPVREALEEEWKGWSIASVLAIVERIDPDNIERDYVLLTPYFHSHTSQLFNRMPHFALLEVV